ncbi:MULTISPECIES: hypothetical protein [unclassified Streptomyces]|uniref:hypothetical protein n=1 Tax=unclassified Streptomyces TaxID=2593676 RepID=UPI0007EE1B7A|nr:MULTISPECIES: hypothetical protein [unclassified Streptomyces]MCP3766861.1 hypothetical protein [Streptomyces sp. MAR25Y5]OBQ51064.1 hypothetical protein A4U61_13185 [Streptomyces sp. H-KF8]
MRIFVGILMSLFGIFFFVGPLFAERTNRTAGGKFFDAYNRVISRLVGGFFAIGGILHAVGIFR